MYSSIKQAAQQFVSYYSDILGTAQSVHSTRTEVLNCCPRLTEQQGDLLTTPVQEAEIKVALQSIAKDKAPGPDDYSSQFFIKALEIAGADLVAAVQEFFRNGLLLKQVNHATISLVRKAAHVTRVEDYRPISCCNVICKVISKILTVRITSVMATFMDPAQAVFLKGRSMMENVFLVEELIIEYGRKRTTPKCMLKVDIRKAFDSIS